MSLHEGESDIEQLGTTATVSPEPNGAWPRIGGGGHVRDIHGASASVPDGQRRIDAARYRAWKPTHTFDPNLQQRVL